MWPPDHCMHDQRYMDTSPNNGDQGFLVKGAGNTTAYKDNRYCGNSFGEDPFLFHHDCAPVYCTKPAP